MNFDYSELHLAYIFKSSLLQHCLKFLLIRVPRALLLDFQGTITDFS